MDALWTMDVGAAAVDGGGDFLDDILTMLEAPADHSAQLQAAHDRSRADDALSGRVGGCASAAAVGYGGYGGKGGSALLVAHGEMQVAERGVSSAVYDQPTTTLVVGSTKGGSLMKRTIEHLRAEAHQLTEELERLRQETKSTRSAAMENAMVERFKRRRAEQECQQLREAVYAHTRFIRGLRSVFVAPPSLASSLNLCQYLHTYTRLPRERSVRWSEYASLAQETRLRNAMTILSRETEAISSSLMPSLSTPYIQTEHIGETDGFSVTTLSMYAVDSTDVGCALRGACVAVRDILVTCGTYQITGVKGLIVDPEASTTYASSGSNILYRVMGVKHKSLRDDDELSVESRLITLYKQAEDHAVVLWDFVDDDDLNPISETTDVTRQAVGSCLLRREMCDDGVERVVCRSLSTRRYRFHDHAPLEMLQRFHYSYARASTMRGNELIFRRILMDEIEKEKAAYASALGQLTVGRS